MIEDSLNANEIKVVAHSVSNGVECYPKHDSLLKTFTIRTDIPITLLESTKWKEIIYQTRVN